MSNSFFIIMDVEDGKVRIKDSKPLFQRLKELNNGRYKIRVSRASRSRTVNQNAYYWALMTAIAEETGNTKDEIHEHLKYKFLMAEAVTNDGEILRYLKSTTDLSTYEMKQYIEKIFAWAKSFLMLRLPTFEEFNELEQ